jgi:DNA-binding MarR family transcriptional regulator
MDRPDDPTVQKLWASFMQFRKVHWHQVSAATGCTPGEVRVLLCIERSVNPESPLVKVSAISKLLDVTSPTVTQMLKPLEAKDLVERGIDPTDRRVVGIRLTEKGVEVTQKVMEGFNEAFQGLAEYLGSEQSDQLAELLMKVCTYFSERDVRLKQEQWSGVNRV